MAPARREVLILGAIGAGAAVAGALVGALALQSQIGAAELLTAPFEDVSGARRSLREWQGRVLVSNFWATWCAPCREEIPVLVAVREKFAAKGIEIVGIGIDHRLKVHEFVKSYHITYPVLVTGMGALDLMRRLGNEPGALPYTVVLDRLGAVAHRRLGAFTRAGLEGVVERLLR
ncbi:MAG TPA: TlpA disulfide reductase family protein [Burkholderiales bacterium]|nr:TlpA disulfide reductase family protein [Burkholderiales bacterium]